MLPIHRFERSRSSWCRCSWLPLAVFLYVIFLHSIIAVLIGWRAPTGRGGGNAQMSVSRVRHQPLVVPEEFKEDLKDHRGDGGGDGDGEKTEAKKLPSDKNEPHEPDEQTNRAQRRRASVQASAAASTTSSSPSTKATTSTDGSTLYEPSNELAWAERRRIAEQRVRDGRGQIYFVHAPKSGGTTLCALARANGLRTPPLNCRPTWPAQLPPAPASASASAPASSSGLSNARRAASDSAGADAIGDADAYHGGGEAGAANESNLVRFWEWSSTQQQEYLLHSSYDLVANEGGTFSHPPPLLSELSELVAPPAPHHSAHHEQHEQPSHPHVVAAQGGQHGGSSSSPSSSSSSSSSGVGASGAAGGTATGAGTADRPRSLLHPLHAHRAPGVTGQAADAAQRDQRHDADVADHDSQAAAARDAEATGVVGGAAEATVFVITVSRPLRRCHTLSHVIACPGVCHAWSAKLCIAVPALIAAVNRRACVMYGGVRWRVCKNVDRVTKPVGRACSRGTIHRAALCRSVVRLSFVALVLPSFGHRAIVRPPPLCCHRADR